MKNKILDPYSNWTILGYVAIIFVFVYFQGIILKNPNEEQAMKALLQLGRITGAAFAFLFSLGLYLVRTSENTTHRGRPLFNNALLFFILLFAMSIMLPYIVNSSNLEGEKMIFGIKASYTFSFICLSLMPLVYETIQKRYEPRQVLLFLRNMAIKNMEKTENYTETWHDVLDIDKISRNIYVTDVDIFAAGIRYLCAILNKGVEFYEKRKEMEKDPYIILNRKEIPVEEWIRLIQTRIIWLGEKVVESRLAFERVIVEVIAHVKFKEVIFTICYYLCNNARKKEYNDSLEIGLYHFIPWCKDHGLYNKCKDLELV